jgi:hypothetical protein
MSVTEEEFVLMVVGCYFQKTTLCFRGGFVWVKDLCVRRCVIYEQVQLAVEVAAEGDTFLPNFQ